MNIAIGHYTDTKNQTGCTVFIFRRPARIGIDIRGSNTVTFNTPAFDSKAVEDAVHAIVLSGGSAYGIESVFGVMQFLEENRIAYKTRGGLVPSVTGAVIYDLPEGRSDIRPDKQAGYIAASNAASNNYATGNIGVGTGAMTGKWLLGHKRKGGFGIGSVDFPGDIEATAYVVTNSVGDVIVNPSELAQKQQQFQNLTLYPKRLLGTLDLDRLDQSKHSEKHENTTLAVIATNADLTKHELQKVAELAHDGMARSIYPVHTNMDGDVVFAVSVTPRKKIKGLNKVSLVDFVGIAAADALSLAITNSVSNNQDS